VWYGGPRFNGRKTAGNDVFDDTKMTAAHVTLPFGTQVRVTNLRNNKSQVVTINDRMARRRTVVIDVSRGAAQELDMLNAGRVPVRLEIVR
jgi:rare lipoprotein A